MILTIHNDGEPFVFLSQQVGNGYFNLIELNVG